MSWIYSGNANVFTIDDLLSNFSKKSIKCQRHGSNSSCIGNITDLEPATEYKFTMKACANKLCGTETDPVPMTTCKYDFSLLRSCTACMFSSQFMYSLSWRSVESYHFLCYYLVIIISPAFG